MPGRSSEDAAIGNPAGVINPHREWLHPRHYGSHDGVSAFVAAQAALAIWLIFF
jgi:hypothetical protein